MDDKYMVENGRIKLAEAMGWWDIEKHRSGQFLGRKGEILSSGLKPPRVEIPDPENDANDDYAVLEWMRKTYQPNSIYNKVAYDFAHSLSEPASYQIGDYARAALKVIK